MKCKAAEVLHDKREQACGAEYGLILHGAASGDGKLPF